MLVPCGAVVGCGRSVTVILSFCALFACSTVSVTLAFGWRLGDDPLQVRHPGDLLAVDADDRVAAGAQPLAAGLDDPRPVQQAGLGRGAADGHAGDEHAVRALDAGCRGDRGSDRLAGDAEPGVADVALLERAELAGGGVDRDGEADADVRVHARVGDLGGDPDDPALAVQQRAAGVAVVDRRVGLDRAGDGERFGASMSRFRAETMPALTLRV